MDAFCFLVLTEPAGDGLDHLPQVLARSVIRRRFLRATPADSSTEHDLTQESSRSTCVRGTFGLIYWQRRQHVKLILVFYVRGTLGTKITCTTCRSAISPCSEYYVSVCDIDFGNMLYRSLLYYDMMYIVVRVLCISAR